MTVPNNKRITVDLSEIGSSDFLRTMNLHIFLTRLESMPSDFREDGSKLGAFMVGELGQKET